MRRYDQRLLSTVYWSLGVIGTITAALLLFGWFGTLRIYESDKAMLAHELEMSLQSQLARVRAELESEAKARHSELLKGVSRTTNAAVETLQEQVNRIQDDHKQFKYNFFRLEARHWMKENNRSDALSTYTDALNLASTLNNTYHVSKILGEILSVLEVISRENPAVQPSSTFMFSELEKALEKVPNEHSDLVERIHTILMEMKGRPGVTLPSPPSRR